VRRSLLGGPSAHRRRSPATKGKPKEALTPKPFAKAISNTQIGDRRMCVNRLYFTSTQKLCLQRPTQKRPRPTSTSAPPLRAAPRDLAGAFHGVAAERPATTGNPQPPPPTDFSSSVA
jgi:hypothetical protein